VLNEKTLDKDQCVIENMAWANLLFHICTPIWSCYRLIKNTLILSNCLAASISFI